MWAYRNPVETRYLVVALRPDPHGRFAFLASGIEVTMIGAPYEEKEWGLVISIVEHPGPFPADSFLIIPASS